MSTALADEPISTMTAFTDAFVSVNDTALEEIANAVFIDNGVNVDVSPIDQVILGFIRRLLTDPVTGQFGVVQLPRSAHQSPALLAICAHLYARQAARLRGPVILVGQDIAMNRHLRTMSVQARRRMGLKDGNPLSAHRVTGTGKAVPLIGPHAGHIDQALLVLNTRVGWPRINCNAPLIVIDATSIASPTSRLRALEWATEQGPAALLAVCDVGDNEMANFMRNLGVVPVVLPLLAAECSDIAETLGSHAISSSTFSTMGLVSYDPAPLELHTVPPSPVDDALERAWVALGSKPKGETIPEVDRPFKMLRNLQRLAASLTDYRTACTDNVRGGEMPALGALERVDVTAGSGRKWSQWATVHLGPLKVALRELHAILEGGNPKTVELWRLLEQVDRDDPEAEILIRCHSRAAAEATHRTLAADTNTEAQRGLWARIADRVVTATFKQRIPADTFSVQILVSPPPPWLFATVLGVEADRTVVMGYAAEQLLFRKQRAEFERDTATHRDTAARIIGYKPLGPVSIAVTDKAANQVASTAKALQSIPALGIGAALARIGESLDPPEVVATDSGTYTPSASATIGARRCRPLHLNDGRIWWCLDDDQAATSVVALTAAGAESRSLEGLRVGDRIIVPAGDGTESIHARLVAASRSNDDVRSLDMILTQFRAAALIVQKSGTAAEVRARLEGAGASAVSQIANWRSGDTIAPRDPDDVRIVFELAGRAVPDLALVYAVADQLRNLHRVLGHLAAAVAGGDDDARERLVQVVGPAAHDILDEYAVAEITSIGEPRLTPAGQAGRVQRPNRIFLTGGD